ncbi:hypothetical protein [Alkalibacillus aidingensis]|uniref:hypothetical protein n=1 Tax=Alkalibacillus aidingensis TaxID=2747607 RepID=UPI00166096F5|nr:hypothetical protein [Alkalibacillus aidingensis]
MITTLIVIISILFVITLVSTLLIAKEQNRKIKEYERQGTTAKEELERSIEYEDHSLKSNVPMLSAIYIVSFVIIIIAIAIIVSIL